MKLCQISPFIIFFQENMVTLLITLLNFESVCLSDREEIPMEVWTYACLVRKTQWNIALGGANWGGSCVPCAC